MIVKLEILYDDISHDGSRGRDDVVRAIDKALGGADWQASGNGWIARRE